MNEDEIIKKLRQAFKDDIIKRQVLQPDWHQLNIASGIHCTGFCFAASEVIYRLTGCSKTWMVKHLPESKDWPRGTHYFLLRKQNNEVVDITADQYTSKGIDIPYHLGKGRGLCTISHPARRLARLSGLGEL